jgi:hypothetical protein
MKLICRAGLLAGILAIVAGILGMHTMTGNHAAHTLGAASPSSSAAAPVSMALASGHSHGHSAHSASDRSAGPDGPAADAAACAGSFAATDLPGAACTPLAKAGSFAAPAPNSAGQLAEAHISSGVTALRFYSYLPAGPSPGDLSISRT